MTKLILTLLGKLLIGMLAVGVIMLTIIKLCKYIGDLWGEVYGFLCFIFIAVIIGIVSNILNKKRKNRILEANGESENELNKN